MDNYSYIRVHRDTIPTPLGYVFNDTFEWVGDSPYVYIDPEYNEEKDGIITVGQFKLRIVETSNGYMMHRCIRVDYPFSWIIAQIQPLKKIISIFYHRVIITLAVWGLAEYEQGRIPSWKDIKVFKNG